MLLVIASVEATERSMLPVMIMKVMGRVIIPLSMKLKVMSNKLRVLRK